jgi:hypothetical protein
MANAILGVFLKHQPDGFKSVTDITRGYPLVRYRTLDALFIYGKSKDTEAVRQLLHV